MTKEKFIFELYGIQNALTEEQNVIEVLKGYCENNLENSDEINKIYPFISMIYDTHRNTTERFHGFLSGL